MPVELNPLKDYVRNNKQFLSAIVPGLSSLGWALFSLSAISILLMSPTASAADSSEATWCTLNDPAVARVGSDCAAIKDPQTLPEEVVLGMPCGHKMMFRKVIVPGNHYLDHQNIVVGGTVNESIESELLKRSLSSYETTLSGGFSHGEGDRTTAGSSDIAAAGDRSYYIGKYEVLAHQFDMMEAGLFNPDAATPETCEAYNKSLGTQRPNRARPKGGLSWFDAIDFVRAYSRWLISEDQELIKAGKTPVLPWEHGSTSYVRIPTEAEWEYAARGGLARSQDASVSGYRIKDKETGEIRRASVSEVAVLRSPNSRKTKLRPVGTTPPNLFGLYDTIGNVEEIVLDSFRAIRPDAPHGQAGGYIVKGGDLLTGETFIGVGYRGEVPYFSSKGETRSAFRGVRLAISVPVFVDGGANYKGGRTNIELEKALQKSQEVMTSSQTLGRGALEKSLSDLKKNLEEGTVKRDQLLKQLKNAENELQRSNSDLNRQKREVDYERLRSLVFTARSVATSGYRIYLVAQKVPDLKKVLLDPGKSEAVKERFKVGIEKILATLPVQEGELMELFGIYLDAVQKTAELGEEELKADLRRLKQEITRSGVVAYNQYIEMAQRHIVEARRLQGNIPAGTQSGWLDEIDKNRKKRPSAE